eukprot:242682_1
MSRSVSRSRSRSPRRYSSRSPVRKNSFSRSRSRDRSRGRTRRSPDRGGRGEFVPIPKGLSRHQQKLREAPPQSSCVGVFGLSQRTVEEDLEDCFSRYAKSGPIERVTLIRDRFTRKPRGYGFIYFKSVEDAAEAIERMNGMELDGRSIRVDYSITHDPPGGRRGGRRSRSRSPRRDRY